jgi:hypothetical protein
MKLVKEGTKSDRKLICTMFNCNLLAVLNKTNIHYDFIFRHLAMQKLRTTIIRAVLANLFKLTTKKMEWFMGKLKSN